MSHKFRPLVKSGFQFCEHCGLINLKNAISTMCIKLGCDYQDTPQFKQWLKSPKEIPL